MFLPCNLLDLFLKFCLQALAVAIIEGKFVERLGDGMRVLFQESISTGFCIKRVAPMRSAKSLSSGAT